MNLTRLAIKRGVAFTMLFIAILGFGGVSLLRLNPELLPDITFPVILVSATYSGTGPEEMENLVTRPIEEAVSTVGKVKEISSTVGEGQTMTILEFEWGTDMDLAAFDVREKLDLVESFLPEDVQKPFVFKFDPTMMPVMEIGIFSKKRDPKEIRKITEDKMKPHLERIEGVARATVFGGLEREIQVNLQRSRLQAYRIPIQQVIGAIAGANLTLPGGSITRGKQKYIVRTKGEFESLRDIENVIVSYNKGVPVRIKDLGEVLDGTKDVSTVSRVEEMPGVIVMINKRSDAVTVDVSKEVKSRLKSLRQELPEDVDFDIFWDQSDYINKSIGRLYEVAGQGALFAVFILLLFLVNLRSTIIIAVAIPMCIVVAFSAMDATGITINMISMGGLALAIGMLVDNAIVVLENTYRHMESGKDRRTAALIGTQEVTIPIIASTFTTVSVFLPVVFVPGMVGIMFRDMSLTVVISLLASLFVALTFIPLLCSRFLKVTENVNVNSVPAKIRDLFQHLDRKYERALRACLSHKRILIFSTIGLFLLTIFMVYPLRMLGTEFFPKGDEGMFQVSVELPIATELEFTENVVQKVEAIVRQNVPDLEYTASMIGGDEMEMAFGGGAGKSHFGTVYVGLPNVADRNQSQWDIMEELKPKLRDIPGARITVKGFGGMMGGGPMGGQDAPVCIEIFGYDLGRASELANEIKTLIEEVRGTDNVETSTEYARPELCLRINRNKAHSLGLSVGAIANTIESSLQGKVAGLYRESGDEFHIRVRLTPADRKSLEDLRTIPINSPLGSVVPLQEVVDISPAAGPTKINRKGQERLVTVTCDNIERDLGSVVRDIESKLSQVTVPPDFSVKMGGQAEKQKESFKWLALALIGAIFLVYMM
jgi:HAE1 family hydrophobic/amphiphilic exporter-1